MEKTIRCTDCAAEFTDAETTGISCCPSCGSEGVPCSISQDATIKINWHELRILTIWASNWASSRCDEGCQKTLTSIIKRLHQYRQEDWAPLTILEEVKELPDQLREQGIECGGVEYYDHEGNRLVPPPLRVLFPEDDTN